VYCPGIDVFFLAVDVSRRKVHLDIAARTVVLDPKSLDTHGRYLDSKGKRCTGGRVAQVL
jgi:hypothetical protein